MTEKWKKGDKLRCTLYPSIYSEEEGEVLEVDGEYLRVRFNLSKIHEGLDHATAQTFTSDCFERLMGGGKNDNKKT